MYKGVDDFIKKNQDLLTDLRRKEKIRLLRRNTMAYKTLKDKMKLFRNIHENLNQDLRSSKHDMKESQINPVIIKNFYDYTMNNEKKIRDLSRNDQGNSNNENIGSNVVNIYNYNITNINLNINKFERKHERYNSEKIKQNILDNLDIINIDKRKSSVLIRNVNMFNRPIKEYDEEEYEKNGRDESVSESNKESDDFYSECEDVVRSEKSQFNFCECKQHVNKNVNQPKIPRKFSLISNKLLSNIAQEKHDSPSTKNFNQAQKRNSVFINPPAFFGKFGIGSLNNAEESPPTITKHIQYSQFSNHCESCGGIMTSNPELNESINTYVHGFEIDSRKNSLMFDDFHFINGASRRTSIIPLKLLGTPIIKKQAQIMQNRKSFDLPIRSSIFRQGANHNKNSSNNLTPYKNLKLNTIIERQEDRKSTMITDTNKPFSLTKTAVEKKVFKYNLKFFEKENEEKAEQTTRLSLQLSKKTTLRLITVILVILFLLPYLDSDTFINMSEIDVYQYELILLENHLSAGQVDVFLMKYNNYILNDTTRNTYTKELVEFGFNNLDLMCYYQDLCNKFNSNTTLYIDNSTLHAARLEDKVLVNSTNLYMIYTHITRGRIEALLEILKILFVSSLLWLGAFLFLKDINHLVVIPLEATNRIVKEQQIKTESLYCSIEDLIGSNIKKEVNISLNEFKNIEQFFLNSKKLIIRNMGLRGM